MFRKMLPFGGLVAMALALVLSTVEPAQAGPLGGYRRGGFYTMVSTAVATVVAYTVVASTAATAATLTTDQTITATAATTRVTAITLAIPAGADACRYLVSEQRHIKRVSPVAEPGG